MIDVTWADVCRETTMCSTISARILVIGSTTSPGHGSGGRRDMRRRRRQRGHRRGAARRPTRGSCRRSRLVTRPAMPEPVMAAISTPCSAAMRRTRGDDLGAEPLLEGMAVAGSGRIGALTGGGATACGRGHGGRSRRRDAAGAGAGGSRRRRRRPSRSRSARRPSAPRPSAPSATRISASTPAAGDGISASTLSVEISKIGSSRLTSSPTFFSHRESVPSAIDSPICGMMHVYSSHGITLCPIWRRGAAAAPSDEDGRRERIGPAAAPMNQ